MSTYFDVRDQFYDRLGVSPMSCAAGPNNSHLMWFQIGKTVCIVQVFKEEGLGCVRPGRSHQGQRHLR